MGQFEDLQSEIQTDPLARGYAGLTDQQVLDSMNAVDRDNWITLTAAEIFEALDATEFGALDAGQTTRVDRILGLGGDISTAPGAKARAEMVSVFGGGSTTITNLATIANQQVSRAQELGLAGYISVSRIGAAR